MKVRYCAAAPIEKIVISRKHGYVKKTLFIYLGFYITFNTVQVGGSVV